ncbi:MAG: nucleotidyltransferase domain-containing protein [Myxococcota bacterium]
MERAELVRRLGRAFASREGVSAAYLFGSRARGTERPTSDVDVGVLFAQPRARGLVGLPTELEAALGEALSLPVQVIDLERASPDLVHRVLRDGILVSEADPSARVRFEVKRRNEYFDVLPHLERYRRAQA